MKSLIAFAQVLVGEAGKRCGISTERDQKTITLRTEHEGLSFLTITLPTFSVDLQKGLAEGRVSHDLFLPFRSRGELPQFLGGFLDLVFDRSSGLLLDDPSWEAIRCMRQISRTFAKMKLPCTDARNAKALRAYIECEDGVRLSDKTFPSFQEDFVRVSQLLFRDVFSKLDLAIESGLLLPKHGSGSTADRLLGNAKYDQKEWTERLDSAFPVMDWLVPTYRHREVLDQITILSPRNERPVKVTLVPKSLKTPRIIAMEPTCMMYAQQALLEMIVEVFSGDDLLENLIGWQSQLPNQELARQGSITGSFATLDLSEASDRVSNQHVRALLSRNPPLFEAVDACRSRKADVPGHGVIRLAKFASMGSALCFPFEEMVFLTIVFLGIEDELRRPLTSSDVSRMKGKVRVFGDDIIVPTHTVQQVTKRLESFGMRVNTTKSYGTGKFRESCGAEYFDGHRVNSVKIGQMLPTLPLHVDQIVSTCAARNLLWEDAWYDAVDFLDRILERMLPVYPVVPKQSAALGRHSFAGPTAERICPDLHIPLIKACVVKASPPTSLVSGYGSLVKFFLRRGDFSSIASDHLLRAGRPSSVRIKTRWVSAVNR